MNTGEKAMREKNREVAYVLLVGKQSAGLELGISASPALVNKESWFHHLAA